MPVQAQVEVQVHTIHKLGARREWMVSTTAQPFSQKRHIPIVQEAGWALGLLRMGMENLTPTGIQSSVFQVGSELLYKSAILAT